MENFYMEDFPGTKYRVNLIKESSDSAQWMPLSNPGMVFDYLKPLEDKDREYFVAVFLNAKNIPIGVHLISIGDLTSATVSPRECYKAAILASAAAVVYAHNHPSGDPDPSSTDMKITQKLKDAGDLLGIQVFDHIIVGRNCYYSFKEAGQL